MPRPTNVMSVKFWLLLLLGLDALLQRLPVWSGPGAPR